jgi:ABC-type spermidine/putrescine transport system permease subunit I
MKPKGDVKKNLIVLAMLAPALLITIGIVIYPIINTIINSFLDEAGNPTLANYAYLFTDELAVAHTIYTLWVAVVTVVISMIFAYLLALYLRFSDTKISKTIGTLYLLPRFIPNLVTIYAVMTIVRDSGLINRILMEFGVNFKPGLLYNSKGVIMMNVIFNIPFATMIIVAALSSISESIVESARDVGAGRFRVFFQMVLPLSFKDVMIAMVFIFMSNISSFTTPYLIGRNHPLLLGVYLRKTFANRDYNLAAAISVLIFLFSSISAFVYLYTNLKEKDWESRAPQ